MKYFLTVLIMAGFVLPAAAETAEWKTFTSEAGSFSVLMPGTPTFSDTTDHTVVGDVGENLFSLDVKEGSFSAEYSDLPRVAVIFDSAKSIYKDAKEGLLKETGASEKKYYIFIHDGMKGRELEYEVPAGGESEARTGKARFLLKDKRLYVLVGTVPKKDGDEKLIDRFLDSFKLLKKK